MNVSARFSGFLSNIAMTELQVEDGITKHTGVRSCLNSYYWNVNSGYSNSMLVGAWGKATPVRPVRDIDILFALPYSVYERYEQVSGNKQSQLLQEVKSVLTATYSSTKMRGDGQVVVVPFASQPVEVLPAFKLQNGQYWMCNTHDGGKYKTIDPDAEIKAVADSDSASSGNTRHLARMLKKWQEYCSVALKSFVLELLAIEFISTWEHRGKSTVYYDWMVRDFFKFLIGKAGSYVTVPGSYEIIWLGTDWKTKAESAHGRAVKACSYEAENKEFDAYWEWKNIFGDDVPHN
jgi:hypothetical protein